MLNGSLHYIQSRYRFFSRADTKVFQFYFQKVINYESLKWLMYAKSYNSLVNIIVIDVQNNILLHTFINKCFIDMIIIRYNSI
jgi:ABC-type maltose transport system permease subunit